MPTRGDETVMANLQLVHANSSSCWYALTKSLGTAAQPFLKGYRKFYASGVEAVLACNRCG